MNQPQSMVEAAAQCDGCLAAQVEPNGTEGRPLAARFAAEHSVRE
jgi:hypothetical protein